MQGVGEYSLCYGPSHLHPMQGSNLKVLADMDPRAAPPPPFHFSPRDAVMLDENTETSSFLPSLAQFPSDAVAVTTLGFNDEEPTKVCVELKQHATACCRGDIGSIGPESSKSDGLQQEVLRKSKMPLPAFPSEVLNQQVSPTSSRCNVSVMTSLGEHVSGQGLFHSSDPRFHTDAHSVRPFCHSTSRENPYIDTPKSPVWPHFPETAGQGIGYSFTGEEWTNYGMVGNCPSVGAVPNYVHHHPGYKGEIDRPAFPTSAILQQSMGNGPAFFSDHLQPAAGGNAVDYTSSVGLPGPVGGCLADPVAGDIWPGAYRVDEGRWASDKLVGKSQSMRALYCCHKEENEALRRALYSMKRAADRELARFPEAHIDPLSCASASLKNPPGRGQPHDLDARIHARLGDKMQDRYVARDVAEGRTVSMRERGKWCAQGKIGGEIAGDGIDVTYPIWSGQATRKAFPDCWCLQESGGAFYGGHRLYFGGGGGGGRWQEAESEWLRSWDGWHRREATGGVTQSKIWQGNGGDGSGSAELTVKEQLPTRGVEGGTSATAGVDESRCAMCDGKLRRLRQPSATKKLGLPLRLCPACHPRPAASLPPSTTKASTTSPSSSPAPPLRPSPASARGRHHVAATVATAISIACKPNTANPASSDPKKKPKNRIVDLCRHLVGMTMKPSAG